MAPLSFGSRAGREDFKKKYYTLKNVFYVHRYKTANGLPPIFGGSVRGDVPLAAVSNANAKEVFSFLSYPGTTKPN